MKIERKPSTALLPTPVVLLGVAVAMSLEEAEAAVAFTDGTTVAPMVPAQDHKRALASADAGMV